MPFSPTDTSFTSLHNATPLCLLIQLVLPYLPLSNFFIGYLFPRPITSLSLSRLPPSTMLDLRNVFMILLCVSKIRRGFYGSRWPSMHKKIYSGMLSCKTYGNGKIPWPYWQWQAAGEDGKLGITLQNAVVLTYLLYGAESFLRS